MKSMSLNNLSVEDFTVISLLVVSAYQLGRGHNMDSKLSVAISKLGTDVSQLATSVDSFLASQGTPILAPGELDGVLASLGDATTSIEAVIAKLTPTSVSLSDTSSGGQTASSSQPAPPSSN